MGKPGTKPGTPGTVTVNFAMPVTLHRTVKTLAAARGLGLYDFIIESLTAEVARGYAPAREPRGAASG